MKIVRHIPNFITTLNLVCGFIAIILACIPEYIQLAPFFVLFGAIFDFGDGFTARLLRVSSSIGKELDSLADVVTFGVAPGIIAFQMMLMALDTTLSTATATQYIFLATAAFIPAMSAVRLAIFNLDENQTTDFIGMATPASAMLILSLSLIFFMPAESAFKTLLHNPWILACVYVIDGFLMVSKLKMFSLKLKGSSFSKNAVQYIFVAASLLLIITLKIYALFAIIVLYILSSIALKLFRK